MVATRIVLTRHAEKPADPYNPHLSAAGSERAQKLAHFIPTIYSTGTHYIVPGAIFAASNTKHSYRPYETMLPLSQKFGVAIDTSFGDPDYAALAKELLELPYYAGKFIVICWHHGYISDLAAALKAPAGTYPERWPEDLFNVVLAFDYGSGSIPQVEQITETF